MSRSIVSRSLAVVMAIVVAMAFSFVPAENTYAASKKTVYRIVSSTYTAEYSKDDVEKWTSKYTYDKRGLLKKSTTNNPYMGYSKINYKRNKKGALTNEKAYKGKKLVSETKYKLNKKGLPTKETEYDHSGDITTVSSVTKNTYYGNGNLKKVVYTNKEDGSTYTDYFRKNGTIKKSVSKGESDSSTTTFDKKGYQIKQVYSYDIGGDKVSGTRTYKNKYNKKGNLIKQTETDKYTSSNSGKKTDVTTTTFKYKYDKHGNIVKETQKSVYDDGEYKSTSTYTSTYKYKKFKVDKKYLKFMYRGSSM